MSFLHPVVLVALVAIPLVALWYVSQQRQRTKAAEAFANPKLNASVAPSDRDGAGTSRCSSSRWRSRC